MAGRWPAALGLAVALAGCAGPAARPIGETAGRFVEDADERDLRVRADRESGVLTRRLEVDADPRLAAYLSGIAARLWPDAARAAGVPAPYVTILLDAGLATLTLPNGRVFVTSGLLARASSEAEAAALLAREVVHVSHRHALRRARADGSSAGLGSVRVARAGTRLTDTIALGALGDVVLGLGLGLSAGAALDGHGADLEAEADQVGLERLLAAGYDPRHAARLWETLRAEGTQPGRPDGFFLGRQLELGQRLAAARRFVDRHGAYRLPSDLVQDRDAFQALLVRLIRDNARLEARVGRFAAGRRQLDRVLAAAPADPLAHRHAGELHRWESMAGGPGTQVAAARRRAREAFVRYLELAPGAADAARVRQWVDELGR